MSTDRTQASPTGQAIFFEIVESAGPNRADLASIGLAMANADEGRPITLARILCQLRWIEYQAVLSMLSLRAHAPVHWTDRQMEMLMQWADEPGH